MTAQPRLCRARRVDGTRFVGLMADDATVVDLTSAGGGELAVFLESDDPVARLSEIDGSVLPTLPLAEVRLLPPVEKQEIWAAGVTYLRSKAARMDESDFSAKAYDEVYEAGRPEIFFKAVAAKVVGPGDAVGVRADSRWTVPEPELALVINSKGRIVGCTVGNDMSSRDIEGENLLYLPQAKIYDRSCALGPWITLGASEEAARGWGIDLSIQRGGKVVFHGQTSVGQLKRRFGELVSFLFRSQQFPHGAVLLTGTGVVPSDDFSLREGDIVAITIDGIGKLANPVVTV